MCPVEMWVKAEALGSKQGRPFWDFYLDTSFYTYTATFARALINRTNWDSEVQSPLLLGAFTILDLRVTLFVLSGALERSHWPCA